MSYRLIVRPEAEADISDAYHGYEREVPGLGTQFLEAVDDGFNRISDSPLHYAILVSGIRRKLLGKFPYALFFVFEANEVRVLSVLQQARNPGLWVQGK